MLIVQPNIFPYLCWPKSYNQVWTDRARTLLSFFSERKYEKTVFQYDLNVHVFNKIIFRNATLIFGKIELYRFRAGESIFSLEDYCNNTNETWLMILNVIEVVKNRGKMKKHWESLEDENKQSFLTNCLWIIYVKKWSMVTVRALSN